MRHETLPLAELLRLFHSQQLNYTRSHLEVADAVGQHDIHTVIVALGGGVMFPMHFGKVMSQNVHLHFDILGLDSMIPMIGLTVLN